MKRNKIAKIYLAVCLVLGMMIVPGNQLKAQAEEKAITVTGTVASGTTAELLQLSTKDGKMEIKLDSGTDTSACKILLPGNEISVSVVHGSDEYLHAVKITSDGQEPGVTIDSANTAVVTGTIGDKTKGDVLYFNTPQGEMQIKLDATTNISGCSVLVVDKSYSITCARGSDAYMHAISISDAEAVTTASGTSTTGLTPAPASPVNVATVAVTGTVGDSTKEDLLYLSTEQGVMEIKIDSNTDSRSGMVLTPGNKLTVYVYRGSDAYMHAASIVGVKASSLAASFDTSTPASVEGTVGSKSNENVLYLKTPQGEMELKLDTVMSVSNCKVFVSGKKLTVTCARGSDAYMHAFNITGV